MKPLERIGPGRAGLLDGSRCGRASSAFVTRVVASVHPVSFSSYAVGEKVAGNVTTSRHAVANAAVR